MRGKTFKIKRRAGPKQALAILKDAVKAYKKAKKRSNGSQMKHRRAEGRPPILKPLLGKPIGPRNSRGSVYRPA
jgi:hypothetical protein